jgi:hypothetical protein
LMEMNLVLQLMRDLEPAARSAQTRRWLHAWNRLEQARDPNFDRTVSPSLAGATPEAAAAYRLATERFNQQYELQIHGAIFTRCAERYLIRAYSRSPKAVAELRQSLAGSRIDAQTKARILKAVSAAKFTK